ncbi:MAG: glycosyltransferase [Phenylobacterium sp.]|nr:MAG: glycosyltransferase [Phenylobacterium sp.]
MNRIVYSIYSAGGLQGGHKVILRHVETLRDLGFDAVAYTGARNKMPTWFEHRVPVLIEAEVGPDKDALVLPDDAANTLRQLAALPYRVFVIAQSRFEFASRTFDLMDRFPPERLPVFIAVAPGVAAMIAKAYPQAEVGLVPAFADERLFRPAPARQAAVAYIPRKRPLEAAAIRAFLQKFHPQWRDLPWRGIENASEAEVAQVFGASSLFLGLSRLEGLGLTPLEAMASGCVCAGFTGIGGRDYVTPQNGFWVPEDDCEAAAEALAAAADLVRTGGPALAHHLEAGYETARLWSYAAFRTALEAFWMRHAPAARLKAGPLD